MFYIFILPFNYAHSIYFYFSTSIFISPSLQLLLSLLFYSNIILCVFIRSIRKALMTKQMDKISRLPRILRVMTSVEDLISAKIVTDKRPSSKKRKKLMSKRGFSTISSSTSSSSPSPTVFSFSSVNNVNNSNDNSNVSNVSQIKKKTKL